MTVVCVSFKKQQMYYSGRSCENSTIISSYSRAAIAWSACDSGHLLRVTHAPILSVSERDRNLK